MSLYKIIKKYVKEVSIFLLRQYFHILGRCDNFMRDKIVGVAMRSNYLSILNKNFMTLATEWKREKQTYSQPKINFKEKRLKIINWWLNLSDGTKPSRSVINVIHFYCAPEKRSNENF